MDELAKAYAQVRDATHANSRITVAEKLGVLELVKAEILEVARISMNDVLSEERR